MWDTRCCINSPPMVVSHLSTEMFNLHRRQVLHGQRVSVFCAWKARSSCQLGSNTLLSVHSVILGYHNVYRLLPDLFPCTDLYNSGTFDHFISDHSVLRAPIVPSSTLWFISFLRPTSITSSNSANPMARSTVPRSPSKTPLLRRTSSLLVVGPSGELANLT